jgi:hypothetical protein
MKADSVSLLFPFSPRPSGKRSRPTSTARLASLLPLAEEPDLVVALEHSDPLPSLAPSLPYDRFLL